MKILRAMLFSGFATCVLAAPASASPAVIVQIQPGTDSELGAAAARAFEDRLRSSRTLALSPSHGKFVVQVGCMALNSDVAVRVEVALGSRVIPGGSASAIGDQADLKTLVEHLADRLAPRIAEKASSLAALAAPPRSSVVASRSGTRPPAPVKPRTRPRPRR